VAKKKESRVKYQESRLKKIRVKSQESRLKKVKRREPESIRLISAGILWEIRFEKLDLRKKKIENRK